MNDKSVILTSSSCFFIGVGIGAFAEHFLISILGHIFFCLVCVLSAAKPFELSVLPTKATKLGSAGRSGTVAD